MYPLSSYDTGLNSNVMNFVLVKGGCYKIRRVSCSLICTLISFMIDINSNLPVSVISPCAQAAKESMDCLNRNDYDRASCTDFFIAYRDCKKAWVRVLPFCVDKDSSLYMTLRILIFGRWINGKTTDEQADHHQLIFKQATVTEIIYYNYITSLYKRV